MYDGLLGNYKALRAVRVETGSSPHLQRHRNVTSYRENCRIINYFRCLKNSLKLLLTQDVKNVKTNPSNPKIPLCGLCPE